MINLPSHTSASECPREYSNPWNPTCAKPNYPVMTSNEVNNLGFGIGRMIYHVVSSTYNSFIKYWYPHKKKSPEEILSELQERHYKSYITYLDRAITEAIKNSRDNSKLKTVVKIIKEHFYPENSLDRFTSASRATQIDELKIKIKALNSGQQKFIYSSIKCLHANRLSPEEIKDFQNNGVNLVNIEYDARLEEKIREHSRSTSLRDIKWLVLEQLTRGAEIAKNQLREAISRGINTRLFRDLLIGKNKVQLKIFPIQEKGRQGYTHVDTREVHIGFFFPPPFTEVKTQMMLHSTLVNELFSQAICSTNNQKKTNTDSFFPVAGIDESKTAKLAKRLRIGITNTNARMQSAKKLLEKVKNNHILTSSEEKQWGEIKKALHNFQPPQDSFEPNSKNLNSIEVLADIFLAQWKTLQETVSNGEFYKRLPQAKKDHEYISFFESYPSEAKQYFFKEVCDLLSEFHEIEAYCNHKTPSFSSQNQHR